MIIETMANEKKRKAETDPLEEEPKTKKARFDDEEIMKEERGKEESIKDNINNYGVIQEKDEEIEVEKRDESQENREQSESDSVPAPSEPQLGTSHNLRAHFSLFPFMLTTEIHYLFILDSGPWGVESTSSMEQAHQGYIG